MTELSIEQLRRQDYVDNAIFDLVNHLNPSEKEIAWNIQMLADIREQVRYWLVDAYRLSDELAFYPFVEE